MDEQSKCRCGQKLDWTFKNLEEIVVIARFSYQKLQLQYGILPNAWLISPDVVEIMKNSISISIDQEDDVNTRTEFMGLPVNIVDGTGVIKAIIQQED